MTHPWGSLAGAWWPDVAKQVHESLLTRGLLRCPLYLVGGPDEPLQADVLAAPSPPPAAQGGRRCPDLPKDTRRAGTRPRAPGRRHRRDAGGDPPERPQLGRRLRPRGRSGGPGRPPSQRPPLGAVRGDRVRPVVADAPL